MARRHRGRRHGHRGGIGSLLRQALLEGDVRYGGEEAGLRELLRQARHELHTGVGAERGAAQGIQASVKEARPQLRNVYSQAGQSLATAKADTGQDLSKLGPSADRYRAVAAREQGDATAKLIAAGAQAQTDLTSRATQAEQGRAFSVRNLLSQYKDESGKIGRQKQALAGQKAAFVISTYGDLSDAEQKRAMDEAKLRETIRSHDLTAGGQAKSRALTRRGQDITKRGQDISHRDRQKAKKGKGRFTPVQLRGARAQWRKAVTLTRQTNPNVKEGNSFVSFLNSKGIDEPIARGVVQTHLFGGVRPNIRRFLQHNYGLRPKVVHRIAQVGPLTIPLR